MPLYMDRHDVPGATAEDSARAHLADLAISQKYDVEFFSYWFDPLNEAVFCFARAPTSQTMSDVHQAAHGLIPAEIIEVSENDVVRFLGKVHDPKGPDDVTSAFRTILVTDLEGSTALLDRLGQAEYMVLLTEHDLIIRRLLITWRGREVKHTGDGFLISFDDPSHALDIALAIDGAFKDRNATSPEPVLRVRIGLAAGEPVDHNDDIFGAAVTLASRLCAGAEPDHILVSDEVQKLGVDLGFSFGEGEQRSLKGFSQPTTVFELLGKR